MKIENDSEGRFLIQAENLQEESEVEAFKAAANALLPRLQELWERDLVVLSEVTDILPLKGQTISVSDKPSIFDVGTPVMLRLKRDYGRPMDQRTLLAARRLLLCAPFGRVLAQEKEWRSKEYYQKLRDKSVECEIKKARNNAIRDSDMCLKRAYDSVTEFLNRQPELFLQYAILQTMVRERIGTDTGQSSPPNAAIG